MRSHYSSYSSYSDPYSDSGSRPDTDAATSTQPAAETDGLPTGTSQPREPHFLRPLPLGSPSNPRCHYHRFLLPTPAALAGAFTPLPPSQDRGLGRRNSTHDPAQAVELRGLLAIPVRQHPLPNAQQPPSWPGTATTSTSSSTRCPTCDALLSVSSFRWYCFWGVRNRGAFLSLTLFLILCTVIL